MSLYRITGPLLRMMSPERAHELAVKVIAMGLVPVQPRFDNDRLAIKLAGLSLPNPVGLAAGFDKNAQTLPHIFSHGFGFAECGTITPKPQVGNPKPRVFRLPDQQAVINRLGFNNNGLDVAVKALQEDCAGIVGGNIGKNKDSVDAVADYVTCLKAVYPYVDYITVNISSPNTQGLRDLQQQDSLSALIVALHEARAKQSDRKPIFVKVAPDLDDAQIDAIAATALEHQLDGLIVSNTTIARSIDLPERFKSEVGGLSGKPLMAPSTEVLKKIYRATEHSIPLIGVGGIASAEDAYAKIRAGASAVQLYTALVYQGFDLITDIKKGLVELLERDGFASVKDAVGKDA